EQGVLLKDGLLPKISDVPEGEYERLFGIDEVGFFLAQRAPEFYCKHNLEWFYRLIKNPSRAGRMMKLPLFLVHVAGEKRK
ncbi:MAG: WecB/TagA/CpsF family glycosyltransferase, partial [Firmicutes bacterium]|nr:WecB/TagA/CpsF family glycosyltransferase [Bacillota bacterium]